MKNKISFEMKINLGQIIIAISIIIGSIIIAYFLYRILYLAVDDIHSLLFKLIGVVASK